MPRHPVKINLYETQLASPYIGPPDEIWNHLLNDSWLTWNPSSPSIPRHPPSVVYRPERNPLKKWPLLTLTPGAQKYYLYL
ncbi:MAG: hypothetical protein QXW60_05470 [Nitrososphaerota archaeon]